MIAIFAGKPDVIPEAGGGVPVIDGDRKKGPKGAAKTKMSDEEVMQKLRGIVR